MKNKGFNNSWQFKKELINILEEGFHKNNTSRTTLRKISKFFKDNPDNIKAADGKVLWPSRFNDLMRYERCFNFIKSGYFNPEGKNHLIALSEIVEIGCYSDNHEVNGTYKFVDKKDSINVITKRDYFDLKLILE